MTLLDGFTLGVDSKTGNETVQIADLVGLIGAVVRTRVTHTRKLSGPELKFIRNALGVRATSLAEFLSMSPEHLSRCEAGMKVLSANSEKELRLFAYLATFYEEPEVLLSSPPLESVPTKRKTEEAIQKFVQLFLSMKIQSVFNSEEELDFQFTSRARSAENDKCGSNHNDSEWEPPSLVA